MIRNNNETDLKKQLSDIRKQIKEIKIELNTTDINDENYVVLSDKLRKLKYTYNCLYDSLNVIKRHNTNYNRVDYLDNFNTFNNRGVKDTDIFYDTTSDRDKEKMSELFNRLSLKLTETQMNYMTDYFLNEYSQSDISKKYGVLKSTVSRVINRGVKNLKQFIIINYIFSQTDDLSTICSDFSFILTDHQRLYLYLYLQGYSLSKISNSVNVQHESSLSNIKKRIIDKLKIYMPDIQNQIRKYHKNNIKYAKQNPIDLKKTAEFLGIKPNIYFDIIGYKDTDYNPRNINHIDIIMKNEIRKVLGIFSKNI